MAVNAPYGLRPKKYLNGANWNGKFNTYFIPSSDVSQYNIGDLVGAAANADANGIPAIQKAAVNGAYRGVCIGFQVSNVLENIALAATPLNYALQQVPATKTNGYYAFVVDDPNVLFSIQDDGLTALTAVDVNLNANVTVANPTAPAQLSATVLTTSSVATTGTLPLKIMGLVQEPGNVFGTYAHWMVKINNHDLSNGSTAP